MFKDQAIQGISSIKNNKVIFDMNKEIETEMKFIWKQLLFILKFPFLLIMVIFRKKDAKELFEPISDFWKFVTEPKVTFGLMLAIIAVFIAEIFMSSEFLESLVFQPHQILQLNFIPMISSWFLHANLLHLTGNLLALFVFGRIIEKRFGPGKTLMIYFVSAILSDIIAALFGQGGIGASGAIAGLIGVAILVDPFYISFFMAGIPLPIIVLGWLFIITDITGILIPKEFDNIGHFAHLGGYIAASLIFFLVTPEERKNMLKGLFINIGFVVAAVILMSYFG